MHAQWAKPKWLEGKERKNDIAQGKEGIVGWLQRSLCMPNKERETSPNPSHAQL